ncbi:dihydroneopterin aldolase [Erythrobacter longus]|uniref:dihydroneopterin aldolase n=1 Tax=Erythrobacter longus TaxID=1044 RepID=UPI000ACEB15F|nr:dihydroneopterin aldolase [Erythrobacter longus]
MAKATIVLEGLELPLDLGTYAPGDVVPEAHLLDATLSIDPALVLVDKDAMERIYDYDPLIAAIEALARDGHYETQEYLLSRIAKACAAEPTIQAVWLKLYKRPVRIVPEGRKTGSLGVTLSLDRAELDDLI